jgi:hypothetical protein
VKEHECIEFFLKALQQEFRVERLGICHGVNKGFELFGTTRIFIDGP